MVRFGHLSTSCSTSNSRTPPACTGERSSGAHALGVELELQVHDQVAAEADSLDAMRPLREAMESIEFDVPMLTDGRWSKVSWGRLKVCE